MHVGATTHFFLLSSAPVSATHRSIISPSSGGFHTTKNKKGGALGVVQGESLMWTCPVPPLQSSTSSSTGRRRSSVLIFHPFAVVALLRLSRNAGLVFFLFLSKLGSRSIIYVLCRLNFLFLSFFYMYRYWLKRTGSYSRVLLRTRGHPPPTKKEHLILLLASFPSVFHFVTDCCMVWMSLQYVITSCFAGCLHRLRLPAWWPQQPVAITSCSNTSRSNSSSTTMKCCTIRRFINNNNNNNRVANRPVPSPACWPISAEL